MGLDVGEAHWSYGGFNRFRSRLAEAEGFDLNEMFGFYGARQWSEIDSVLTPLLDHSDCDGEISPADCAAMVDRLVWIIYEWDEGDYDRSQGEELVKAMRVSAGLNEPLEFW